MPGATFTQASRREQLLDERPRRGPVVDVEGAAARRSDGPGRRRRRRTGVGVDVVASATITAPARPSAARLACGDRDPHRVEVDAGAGEPGPGERDQVAADAAAEVDDGLRGAAAAAARRGARRPASRVACSRPSGVKYIRAASSPNFGAARRRSSTWVSAAATCAGAAVRRSAVWARQRVAGRLGGPRQQLLAVVGQQPAERVEVHAGSCQSPRPGGGVVTASQPLTSRLAAADFVHPTASSCRPATTCARSAPRTPTSTWSP